MICGCVCCEQSFYFLLVYLNSDFEGGATTFITEPEIAIQLATGKILLFRHPIVYEGSIVTSGVKYVARTDLMYCKLAVAQASSLRLCGGHNGV